MTNLRRLACWAAILTILAVALRVGFFCISVTHLQPSADESIARLQADGILKGHFPLLFMAQPYLFPVESYLAAPIVPFLPSDAFGARIVPFTLQLIAAAVALLLLARSFDPRDAWPAALLTLFPSSYFLIMQSAYALPGYSALPLLGGLAVCCALYQPDSLSPRLLAALAGFLGGLAFTSHMLALPFVVAVGTFLCLRSDWRTAGRNLAAFLPGLLIGLAPYGLARLTLPGAYAQISQHHAWNTALERLWSPAITWTLSGAMGTRTTVFPDEEAVNHAFLPASVTGGIWATVMILVILLRLIAFVHRTWRTRRVNLEPCDLYIGIALMTLALFVLGQRADSRSYRYFIPWVWTFPFLVATLYRDLPRRLRPFVAAFAILLAAWNVLSGALVIREWLQPGFAVRHASVADLDPVLARLRARNIRHAVASYGTAYRLTYQSGGRVTAAQPMNERFPGWPIPYKAAVDVAPDVAYVLTDTVRFLKPGVFDRHLQTMGIDAQKEPCGDYAIYSHFRRDRPAAHENRVEPATITLDASHNPEALDKLTDGNLENRWTTDALQSEGMWLRLALPEPARLSCIRLHFGRYFHDHAPEMRITIEAPDAEPTVVDGIKGQLDKFAFRNGHPVYGVSRQTIELPDVTAGAITLTISTPNPRFAWTLTEVVVLARADEDSEP